MADPPYTQLKPDLRVSANEDKRMNLQNISKEDSQDSLKKPCEMINRLPGILDRMYLTDIVTGILPKLQAVKEAPLGKRNKIKLELVQMVKNYHIE